MPRRGMGMGMGMGMGSDGDGGEEEKDLSSSFSSQTSLSSLASSSTASSSSVPVDEECREIMLLWFYSVLDHCRFARENGAAATYLLDLYLATPEGRSVDLLDRSAFQLASMTALFLALKMNEGETVTADMVARLSRGGFRAHDVARQEWRMLRALGFRVHPPTPLTHQGPHLPDLAHHGRGCLDVVSRRHVRHRVQGCPNQEQVVRLRLLRPPIRPPHGVFPLGE